MQRRNLRNLINPTNCNILQQRSRGQSTNNFFFLIYCRLWNPEKLQIKRFRVFKLLPSIERETRSNGCSVKHFKFKSQDIRKDWKSGRLKSESDSQILTISRTRIETTFRVFYFIPYIVFLIFV